MIYSLSAFRLGSGAPVSAGFSPGAVTGGEARAISGTALQTVNAARATGSLEALIPKLQLAIYRHYYTRWDAGRATLPLQPTEPAPASGPAIPDQAWTSQLVAGDRSRERWDAGWRIYAVRPDRRVFVQKGERCRIALPGEYRAAGPPGWTPVPGSEVSLRVAPGPFEVSPGFLFFFGLTPADSNDDSWLIRFYFNLGAEGMSAWTGPLIEHLDRYQIPFQFKCPSSPAVCRRADAGVLYVSRRFFAVSARIVLLLATDIQPGFFAAVPLFAKMLRPGIGMAEDPGTGESFGMHRCRLVAEGIVDAWRMGQHAPHLRLEAVRRRFAANGLDLAQPHLSPGSADFEEPHPAGVRL